MEVGSWDEVIKAFEGTDTTIVLTQDIKIPYIDDSAFPDPNPELGSWTIDANGMSIKSLVNDHNRSDRQPIHAIDGNTVTLQNVGTFTLKAGTRIDDPSSLPDENEGWTGSTRGFIGASEAESQIVLVNSLIQNTTLGDSSWAVHISNGAAAFIVDSLFLNLTGTVHPGSAIGLIEGEASGLWIKGSTFYQNHNSSNTFQNGGAVYASASDGFAYADIIDSYFQENSAQGFGGAVFIHRPRESFIMGTTFESNEAKYGGALTAYYPYLLAMVGSTLLENKAGSHGGGACILKPDTLIIQDTSFIGNEATYGGGLYIELSTAAEAYLVAKDEDVVFSGNTLSGESSDPSSGADLLFSKLDGDTDTAVLAMSAYAGRTISFEDSVAGSMKQGDRPTLRINHGTLKTVEDGMPPVVLDSTNDEDAHQGTVVFRDAVVNLNVMFGGGTLVLTDEADLTDSVHFTEGTGTISLIEPVEDGTARANGLANNSSAINAVPISGLAGSSRSKLVLDVDLVNEEADMLTLADGGTVTGGGLDISYWNVLTDATKESVTVAVSDSADLKAKIDLAEDGATAQGAIYTYDVEKTDAGNYLFTRLGTDPSDLNDDVYAGDAAVSGLSIANHLVDAALLRERPYRWWANAVGSRTEAKPSNFDEVDYDLAAALLGWRMEPVPLGAGRFTVGVFGGLFRMESEYADVDVNQTGGLLGLEAEWRLNDLRLAGNLKAGLADAELKLSSGSPDVTNSWWSFTASAAYDLANGPVRFTPNLALTWLSVDSDSYRTPLGVRVENATQRELTVMPGLELAATLPDGWEAGVTARYAFVSDSGRGGRADDFRLETIEFEDYVEYGLTLAKETDAWRAGLVVEKSSDGRDGWNIRAEAGWKF